MISPNTKSLEIDSSDKTAAMLKALGHPVRLQIIRQLRNLENSCCGDMCDCFPYSQSTISQHLSVLVDVDLVCCKRDGNKSRFSLNPDTFAKLFGNLASLIPDIEKKTN